jgi:hypothetical protein
MQHCTHFVGWQVNIGFAVITNDETVAVAMAGNRAFELCKQAAGRCRMGVNSFNKAFSFWKIGRLIA